MEDGFIDVKLKESDENKVKSKKLNKSETFAIIFTAIAMVIVAIIIAISTSTNNNFENYFGGYNTAEEYVGHLVIVDKIVPKQNTYIDTWYGNDITIKNNSGKVVKYIYYELDAYNSVGDYVESEFDNQKFKITGPINNSQTSTYNFNRSYYCSSTIKSFKITYFRVEFMDNTTVEYNKAMINILNGE